MTGDRQAVTGDTAPEVHAGGTPLDLRSGTRHVVVMGVSGSGKTTVAHGIAAATGLLFAEADDFHSRASVEKMRAGIPLEDEDRWPWLGDLAAWMAERAAEGRSTVIACSALRRVYRDVLAAGPPTLDFVHLDGHVEVIRDRMSSRAGHYMPASLLDSQVATLEPLQPDESGIELDVSLPPEELVAQAVRGLGLPQAQPAT
ncbi:gluconokinase [Knoellia sp. p5-6-4]|uniref:gluconokinase n=1 Tax=unclassified Knoellia TaxID=2618719 RepID=UPI0031F4636C